MRMRQMPPPANITLFPTMPLARAAPRGEIREGVFSKPPRVKILYHQDFSLLQSYFTDLSSLLLVIRNEYIEAACSYKCDSGRTRCHIIPYFLKFINRQVLPDPWILSAPALSDPMILSAQVFSLCLCRSSDLWILSEQSFRLRQPYLILSSVSAVTGMKG